MLRDSGRPTPTVSTPIVTIPLKNITNGVERCRDAIAHGIGKPTPNPKSKLIHQCLGRRRTRFWKTDARLRHVNTAPLEDITNGVEEA